MDFDDIDAPSKVVPRVSRFAPKSSKLRPKPKSEPVPKPEPEPQPSSKPEPQEFDLTAKTDEDRMVETAATTSEKPQLSEAGIMNDEPMPDVELKSEVEAESRIFEAMEEEEEEDSVVREIDVSFTPSINPDTQVCFCHCFSVFAFFSLI